jgi:serine/threonine protein kinase
MTDLRSHLQEGLSRSYALERELGRGGMATVFLAQDLKHDRPVALEVLHPELAATRLAVAERTRAFRASRG